MAQGHSLAGRTWRKGCAGTSKVSSPNTCSHIWGSWNTFLSSELLYEMPPHWRAHMEALLSTVPSEPSFPIAPFTRETLPCVPDQHTWHPHTTEWFPWMPGETEEPPGNSRHTNHWDKINDDAKLLTSVVGCHTAMDYWNVHISAKDKSTNAHWSIICKK